MAFDPADYIPIGEAARLLGLDAGTVYGEVRRRELPIVVVNNRRALHRLVVAFLQADCSAAGDAKAASSAASALAGIPDDPLCDLVDVHEAAVRLGIRSASVHRLIEKKRLPSIGFLGKSFIEKRALAKFEASYDRGRSAVPSAALVAAAR